MAHDQRYPDTQWPTPVYNDFWRSSIWWNTQPDWINDTTEDINRYWNVCINAENKWIFVDASNFSRVWLIKYAWLEWALVHAQWIQLRVWRTNTTNIIWSVLSNFTEDFRFDSNWDLMILRPNTQWIRWLNINLIQENDFWYTTPTYRSVRLWTWNSVSFWVNVSWIAGPNFNGSNECIIPNTFRFTQVNAWWTDFLNWILWIVNWNFKFWWWVNPTTKVDIETWTLNDSWLRLRNILFNQSNAVTNTTAIGIDNTGKVQVSNSIWVADTRATNPQPQAMPWWDTYEFKQSASIWLPTWTWLYAWLETWRRYWFNGDFSWWPIYQYTTTEDWNNNKIKFERNSTSATTWSNWRKIPNQNFRIITATSTLTIWDDIIQVNNGAVNITINLVSPVILWAWAEVTISRWVGSTWTITIQPWAWQIEALANTLWASTSLAASWAYWQNVVFISNWTNWLRKMNW